MRGRRPPDQEPEGFEDDEFEDDESEGDEFEDDEFEGDESEDEDEEDDDGSEGEPSPPGLVSRALRWVPWISLGVSLVGAFWMDRDEGRAGQIAMAIAGSWLCMNGLLWLRRRQSADAPASRWVRAADYAGTAAAQSLLQLPLLFGLPFYVLAFGWTLPQFGFLLALLGVIGISVWDPLAERVLHHPVFGAIVLAFGSFVGLRAALPMMGLGQVLTLVLSVLAVGVSFYWDAQLRWSERWRKLSLPAALLVCVGAGALAPVMPPAPLRMVAGGIGTGVVQRKLVGESTHFEQAPSKLFCWTAIFAPRHFDDSLQHVWFRDDKQVAELDLEVRGGRDHGFRTWTRLTPQPGHIYRCEVRTGLAQVLGSVRAQVGPRP